jgi:hypothetical protein
LLLQPRKTFVVPARAGPRECEMRLDARLRGHDGKIIFAPPARL